MPPIPTAQRFLPAVARVLDSHGTRLAGARVALSPSDPPALRDALRSAGAEVVDTESAPMVRALAASRVVQDVRTHAWAQQAVLAVARATNLSIAHTRVLVAGAGPVAAALATILSGMGARTAVAGGDAAALHALSRHVPSVRVDPEPAVESDVVIVFATGEGSRIDPARLGHGAPLVLVDARLPGAAAAPVVPADGPAVRPGLRTVPAGFRDVVLLDVAAGRDDAWDLAVEDAGVGFGLALLALASPAQRLAADDVDAALVAAADDALARALLDAGSPA